MKVNEYYWKDVVLRLQKPYLTSVATKILFTEFSHAAFEI